MINEILVGIKRFDMTLPLPIYQTAGAAGIDLYARVETIIPARSTALVPLNIALQLPRGTWALLAARSSLHKKSLMMANGVGVGDSDYCGDGDEYRAALLNFSDTDVIVERGERIVQLIIMSYSQVRFSEKSHFAESDRGGFGTTGS
ncbi:dUTP diphosphatase [Candidatus Woesebacteria bacterium]|nr:dUTP diphosphatase [Candidatus Woesebacteria bacterium]